MNIRRNLTQLLTINPRKRKRGLILRYRLTRHLLDLVINAFRQRKLYQVRIAEIEKDRFRAAAPFIWAYWLFGISYFGTINFHTVTNPNNVELLRKPLSNTGNGILHQRA